MLLVNLLKTKKESKNLCKQKMQNHIDRNDLDKDCFRHDMAYGKYKKLAKRTDSEKVSRDKSFKILGNPKMECYKRGLASSFTSFMIKNLQLVVLNLCQINKLQMNFRNQLLEKLNEAKSILLLKTIFGQLILLICN